MRRRTYLTVAVSTIPLAGCSETATDPANGGNGDGGGGDESTSEQSEESNGSAESEPEPEPEPEFEVRSVNAPEEVELGEEWSYSMTVANTGDADGTYTGVVEIDSPAFQQPETSEFSSDITAGEEVTYESGTVTTEIITELTITLEGESTTVQFVSAKLDFGDTYEAPDDVTVTVKWVDLQGAYRYEGFNGEMRMVDASEGRQFAFVEVVVENDSGSVTLIPYGQDFAIRVDQRQYDPVVVNLEEGKYAGGEVGPGVVREGWIAYEIPEELGEEDLTVEWFEQTVRGDHGARWADRESA
jgi:hypothetical protein